MTVTIATVMLCVLPYFASLLFLLLLHHFLKLSHCLCDIFVGIFYRLIINDKLDPVITVSISAACLFVEGLTLSRNRLHPHSVQSHQLWHRLLLPLHHQFPEK